MLRSSQFDFCFEFGKGLAMRGTLTRFNQNSGIGRIMSGHGIDLQVHKSSIDPCPSPLCQ